MSDLCNVEAEKAEIKNAEIKNAEIKSDNKDMNITPEYVDKVFDRSSLLVSESVLNKALNRMSLKITEKLEDKNPVIICIMNGGLMFSAELMKRISFPLELDYVHASRYGNSTKPGTELNWVKYPSVNLSGRYVLLMDDVLDGGVTFAKIKDYCETQGAKAVYTAVMVDKKVKRDPIGLIDADFTAVTVGDEYIFGFGLDFHGYLRNKNGIYAIDQKDY